MNTTNFFELLSKFVFFINILFYFPSIFYHAHELIEMIKLYPIYSSIILNNLRKLEKLENNLDTDCSICLNQFKEDDFINILECQHQFHQDCLDKWLVNSKTCPICRNLIK